MCIYLGENVPYYLGSLLLPAHCGVYQGAKPHIYRDPKDNQNHRVYDYDEPDDCCALHFLGGIPLVRNNQNTPYGLVPGLHSDVATPPQPPSPEYMPVLDKIDSDTDTAPEDDESLLLQDWSID